MFMYSDSSRRYSQRILVDRNRPGIGEQLEGLLIQIPDVGTDEKWAGGQTPQSELTSVLRVGAARAVHHFVISHTVHTHN